MPNTYEGPYPTEREAINAIADGVSVSIDDLRSDRMEIEGLLIQLDDGVGRELIDGLRLFARPIHETATDITATVWRRECVVLQVPMRKYAEDEKPSAVVVLISRSAGRPFAYYAVGDYHHEYPPVIWKRS